jgi:aldose 1-epimerase
MERGSVDQSSGADLRVTNRHGLVMTVSPFGARLVELLVPDRDGRLDNVTLGFDDVDGYRRNVSLYFGATVGRVAGRIAKGEFSLHGQRYELARNEGENHLHGGADRSLDRVEWSTRRVASDDAQGVVFEYLSPHLEEGYPGNLSVRAEYLLTDQNELVTVLTAVGDMDTPVNLTNHTYWTLNGGRPGTILDHELRIAAANVVSVDDELIATGGIEPVTGGALDFRGSRCIGAQLPGGREPWPGFDLPYLLDEHDESAVVASLRDPVSGRKMEIKTSEPSLQVYTANRLAAMAGRAGTSYGPGSAICMEPQRVPAPLDGSSDIVLPAGQEYRHDTRYCFSTQ